MKIRKMTDGIFLIDMNRISKNEEEMADETNMFERREEL